jgi:CPA2 family monovalent cation:H+ antiporter-2
VVEDFAAVLLLTLLSGIATTGTAGWGDVGLLVAKLAVFAVASLALGALFVPRIIRFVSQFRSRETLLLASLALCFTLALLGQRLGISAAAGAVLIGTVIGDTDESRQITGIIEPIRDMFAALFFVSIGMLIDLSLFKDHILSGVIVSGVFIAGKIVANTAGTFVAGQGGRVSLQVGMGKPQIGEFSLAMMKIGAEHEAVRAFLYQVMVGVTAITSLVYP